MNDISSLIDDKIDQSNMSRSISKINAISKGIKYGKNSSLDFQKHVK